MFPMHLIAAAVGRKFPGLVTLSGEWINDARSSGPRAGVRINMDGTVDSRKGPEGTEVYAQIDASTDWIIPNESASGLYEVKMEENAQGGGASTGLLFSSPDSDTTKGLSTWYALTEDREWSVRHGHPSQVATWDIQCSIRFNGGATLATVEFQLQATDI